MANEIVQSYRNTGTKESTKWGRFFNISIADAVKMGVDDPTTIKEYVDNNVKNLDTVLSYELLNDIINKTPKTDNYRDYLNMQRTGKIYQTKVWKYTSNPSSECEKMLDNKGLVCEPSTDTVEGRDDYADIPLFDWFHCNYIRKDNSDIEIIAMEGEDSYKESGSVDVGTTGMTFYWNWDTSNDDYCLLTISDSPNEELGLVPWVESVNADGSVNPYYVHSAYPSTLAEDGLLRSQPYKKIERFQSYNDIITNYQKKGSGYWGAGVCRNTFQIIFMLIKYATKDSQKYFAGVTNHNFRFEASVERDTEDTYFPVTASQANNITIGTYVIVGYDNNPGSPENSFFGNESSYSYANTVKILSIEDMDDGNKAVYLDVDKGFTTTKVELSDELSSPIYMTSIMPITGETQKVIEKHDGSPYSNTSGKFPYRIQGTEYALGAYILATDIVGFTGEDKYIKNAYIAEKGISHSYDEDIILNTYKLLYINPLEKKSSLFIGDINFDISTGAWYPCIESASASQGYADTYYNNANYFGKLKSYLQNGNTKAFKSGGMASLDFNSAINNKAWHVCSCD